MECLNFYIVREKSFSRTIFISAAAAACRASQRVGQALAAETSGGGGGGGDIGAGKQGTFSMPGKKHAHFVIPRTFSCLSVVLRPYVDLLMSWPSSQYLC